MSYISLSRFYRSLTYALRGLRRALATENSFRIHVSVAVAVIFLLAFFRLPPVETSIVILLIITVLSLELVNTIVERFVGILEPRIHPYVGVIKDLMAAAVLIVSVGALVIAFLIFGSHLW